MKEKSPVRLLNPEVARKIAAGEVIDRPNAILRELLDNAVDSGASKIDVEIYGGGIEKIRVSDNGSGMTKEDLQNCARPHATSKITSEDDLMNLTTLGFRGEALSSMAAVSRLEIKSGEWKMNASVTEDHIISPCPPVKGTIVQTQALFENFPARRVFLKREASEATQCRSTFDEKVLARPDISFSFYSDGEEKCSLPAVSSLKDRFCQAKNFFETEDLFYEVPYTSQDKTYSFNLIIGEPSVYRSNRKEIYIFVNGRRIQEYSLMQAIEYGAQGFFPNGSHPVACLFVQIDPSLIDFNIHPAKREARFKDIAPLHHSVSTTTRSFFKEYTLKTMVKGSQSAPEKNSDIENLAKLSLFDEDTEPADLPVSEEKPQVSKFSRESFFGKPQTKPNYIPSNYDYTRTSSVSAPKTTVSTGTSIYYEKIQQDAMTVAIPGASQETEVPKDYSFHFIGMALGTFLIAEKNDVLYIIDQHAAHERYLYNKIMETAGEKQELLVPYVVETENEADDKFLKTIQKSLEESGFTAKDCGNGRWEFTSVPIRWKGTEKDLKKDILDRRINPGEMINATAASTACRMAVMDGTVLDQGTAAEIARNALELPDPHCPHGRPVFTTITRSQLFQLVKRT